MRATIRRCLASFGVLWALAAGLAIADQATTVSGSDARRDLRTRRGGGVSRRRRGAR
jgi:hypothetical protein